MAEYEERMAGVKREKKEILEEARQEAERLLQQSNATIERTIREIKEAKADKEKTKAARKKVEQMKEKVESQKPKVESQKSKEESRKKGVMRDFSELRKLSKTMTKEQETKSNISVRSTVRQRTLAFERTLDLRGYRADEALEKLIAYMDDALMVGARDYLNDLNRQRRKRGQIALEFGDGDVNHGGAGLTVVRI